MLLFFSLYGRCIQVLHFEPIGRAAGAVGGILALRNNAFKAELAGVPKHDSPPGLVNVLVHAQAGSPSPAREASWFRAPKSADQVEDVVYDMGRDYDVMNRQREGVVVAGIIKR